MCSFLFFSSLPLIFTLVAASIFHFHTVRFTFFFLRNWSPLFFFSRSSSFSVNHFNVDIKI